MKKTFEKLKMRIRLRRIERAVGVRLTRRQRQIVLCPDRPIINGWPRRSGKTLTACMWVLMHRERPMILYNDLSACSHLDDDPRLHGYPMSYCFPVPDPDVNTRERALYVLRMLKGMRDQCVKKKIPVFEYYRTTGQYLNSRRTKGEACSGTVILTGPGAIFPLGSKKRQ